MLSWLPGGSSLGEKRLRSWGTRGWQAASPGAHCSAPQQSGSGKLISDYREYLKYFIHLDQNWTISYSTYFEDLLLMQRRGIYSAFLSSHQTAHKSPNLIWSKPGFEFLPSLPPKAGEGPGLGWWVVHLPRLNRDLYWHFDKFCLVRVIAMFASLA